MQCGATLSIMRRRDDQICLRIAGTLREQLDAEAAERARSLSNLIRLILIEHSSTRAAARVTSAEAATEQRI